MQHLQSLKNILHSNGFYVVLILLCSLFVFIKLKQEPSISLEQKEWYGMIEELDIDGNQVNIIMKAKEKWKVSYYLSSIEEKEVWLTYQLGDKIKVRGNVKIPSENRNFNLFNYRNYLRSIGISYIIEADEMARIHKNNHFLYHMKNWVIDRMNSIPKSKA